MPMGLSSPLAASFGSQLFGSKLFRHHDLGLGCWLLHGKIPAALQPDGKELSELWLAKPVDREYYEMYGRPVAVPRYLRLYSAAPLSVRVSGNDFQATQLSHQTPGYLRRLLSKVPACGYNSVVANWYTSGADYIGWHGDREKQIDADSAPIISVSLGAGRRFQVRREATRQTVFDEMLEDGDCVVLGGPDFQNQYKHRVPKMVAKKDGDVGARLNLTVRKYVGNASPAIPPTQHKRSAPAPRPAAAKRQRR